MSENKGKRYEEMNPTERSLIQSKGLWEKMKDSGNTVLYEPKTFSLGDLTKLFQEVQEFEILRRKRLDQEYTPIEQITRAEIAEAMKSEYAHRMSAKVKMGGQYLDLSVVWLDAWFKAIDKEYGKQ